jgi:hypothetical protein
MSDEQRKIIISKISEFHQNGSDDYRRAPVSPVNRWIAYAMLIPVVVGMILIGIFFFAAFLALLAVAVAVIGIRFWWLRRKYEQAMQQPDDLKKQADDDRTVIIEDAQIIEETEIHHTKQKKP